MAYEFNYGRYGLIVFGFTVAVTMLAAALGGLAGLDLTGGALAVLPLIFATGLEARRFGRQLTASPTAQDVWLLARQCAIAGCLTYLLLMFIGGLLIHGPQLFISPDLWVETLGLLALLGAITFFAGFFIIRAVASAAWRERGPSR
ncbi:MAG: ABZJ_00895 family protein [Pseudomonadota bacterium]